MLKTVLTFFSASAALALHKCVLNVMANKMPFAVNARYRDNNSMSLGRDKGQIWVQLGG